MTYIKLYNAMNQLSLFLKPLQSSITRSWGIKVKKKLTNN